LPEKKIPDCAGFLFGFKARQQAHSELCNCWGNAEAEQKDQQDGIFFDRNRLSSRRGTLDKRTAAAGGFVRRRQRQAEDCPGTARRQVLDPHLAAVQLRYFADKA